MGSDRRHGRAWDYNRKDSNRKPKEMWKEFLRLMEIFSFLTSE
jgi:hypothetical protein